VRTETLQPSPTANNRVRIFPVPKGESQQCPAVQAIPDVTTGRTAPGRFLFNATVELFEQYGFRCRGRSANTPGLSAAWSNLVTLSTAATGDKMVESRYLSAHDHR
jgi:hypothetical protein